MKIYSLQGSNDNKNWVEIAFQTRNSLVQKFDKNMFMYLRLVKKEKVVKQFKND